ncbi:MAG: SIS domain-containing protein [Bacteroidota bacterium]
MSTYLGIPQKTLEKSGAIHTAREIAGQPTLWDEIAEKLLASPEWRSFLNPLFSRSDLSIVLTGAGSSDFIGKSAEPILKRFLSRSVRSISTTTLVTHFRDYLDSDTPLLLISFARSGNSPESLAAVERVDSWCREVWHLVITCNPDGALARGQATSDRGSVLLLPPDAHDKSLAMTGSFTGMLLTLLMVSDPESRRWNPESVHRLSRQAEALIANESERLQELSREPFERAVFLGSGPLFGIAREAHLKLQELTDGEVICKYDSFLGFRHGPKALVNEKTVVIYLFSDDPTVFRYEADLAKQIEEEGRAMTTLSLLPDSSQADNLPDPNPLVLAPGGVKPVDALLPLTLLPAQILAFYTSLHRGYEPDQPSKKGTISRVVQGVTIYPDPVDREDSA